MGNQQSPPKRKTVNFDKDVAKFTAKQLEAIQVLGNGVAKYVLYGGALGGGKSYFLRWYCVRRLMEIFKKWGLDHVPVMLACEDYPTLFQSTPPRGGRQDSTNNLYQSSCFNPRPARGATASFSMPVRCKQVSIHAPARGATHVLL